MNPSETARVKECVREIAEILYRYTPPEKCQTLDGIEKTIREHWLETVGPEMAFFCRAEDSDQPRKRANHQQLCREIAPSAKTARKFRSRNENSH
jgi:hypothetical protein